MDSVEGAVVEGACVTGCVVVVSAGLVVSVGLVASVGFAVTLGGNSSSGLYPKNSLSFVRVSLALPTDILSHCASEPQ